MSGITLRFSSSKTTFTEVLSYSTADNKITTDITGIANDTLLYAVLIGAAFWSRKQVLQDEKERATMSE